MEVFYISDLTKTIKNSWFHIFSSNILTSGCEEFPNTEKDKKCSQKKYIN